MPPVHLPEAYPPYTSNLWRVIEGQYRASTMRIVDTDNEQSVLEDILEVSKPPVPEPCMHLDYQLWSPFRYGCYPRASRFRRVGMTPGVWYGSERVLTAVAETIWGNLRFFAASPDTALPRWPVEHTAVLADIRAEKSIDLTSAEMAGQGRWDDPDDYTDCLDLADQVRAHGCQAIRYRSARHPDHGANVAVMRCEAFAQPAPIASQTWHLMLTPKLARAHCETLKQRHQFLVGETQLDHL